MSVPNPTETPATENQSESLSIREQMLQTVEEESKTQDDNGSETEEKEKTEAKPETSEDEKESDDDSEESEEKEQDDKPAKKNRYQRLKAKAQAAEELAKKNSSERDEAVKIANIYRQRLLAMEKKLNTIVKNKGIELDPVEEENFRLKLANQEQELSQKIEEEFQKERTKEEIIMMQRQQSYEFAQEALSVASTFVTDKSQLKSTAAELLKAHAVALRANPDATLKDTARIFMAIRNRNVSEESQIQVNSNAPKPLLKKTTGTKPAFANRREEAIALLDAELQGE